MCGIVGYLNVSGAPASRALVQDMADRVRHRGPDGEGAYVDGAVALGHRRLAILDLSSHGAQPMVSPDARFALTYNGEIYNWRELRRTLEKRGVRFRSDSDTEVLLEAWRAWGTKALDRLNGMFAFAIWDRQHGTITLVRDRYGIKPLYYRWDGQTLLFASEIKAFLAHPGMRVDVDRAALHEYFTFQNVFSERTLFANVTLLPRASALTCTVGALDGPRVRRWWDYEFRAAPSGDEREYVEEVDRLFTQAVARQSSADVEIGTYLSGGIDSGAVTCLAARRHRHIKSFTAGFDLSSASGLELGFDERTKAEQLSHAYKTEHYQVVLKAGDMERVLPSLVWHLEDLRVGQSYPNYYVSRLASRFVKVVLAGTGGDEIFAGYPWRYYRAVKNDDAAQYIDKYFAYWQRLVPEGARERFFQPSATDDTLRGHPHEAFRQVLRRRSFLAMAPDDYINTSLYFELATFLPGLLLVEDKLSMAHGLETRLPFLDNHLVDFALRVPIRYKLKHVETIVRLDENRPGPKTQQYFNETGDGKLLLRKALSRYVPAGYAHGRKQGFSAPDGSWFKGESIDYIRRLLAARHARLYDFIDPATVDSLLAEHVDGRVNHRLLIWSLLCFEWWLRTFRDGEGLAVSLPRPLGRAA